MNRPKREDFETQSDYEDARAKYVEYMLGAGGRLAQRLAALEKEIAELKKKPEPELVEVSMEDQIKGHAHDLIVSRYSASDQFNIIRKGTRVGASSAELLAVEVMDEWIDAVLLACHSHLAELAAMPEDARAGYDWLQGWPKEA